MPIQPTVLTAGPFVGVDDSLTAKDPSRLFQLINGIIETPDPGVPGCAAVRPGLTTLGASVRLSPGSTLSGKRIIDWDSGSTLRTIVLADGAINEVVWSTLALTVRVAATVFVTATITFPATGSPYYATPFRNDLVVVAGATSKPWLWDGTSAGGLTELTDAPFSGLPAGVHGGKLFFVNATDPMTIEWSDEYDPTVGYAATGNSWTLGQTGSTPITAVIGTNEGLYYFRRGGIGIIRGSVTDDFATSSTQDNVSQVTGTTSARTLLYDNVIYFCDQQMRPYKLPVGGAPVPLQGVTRHWFGRRLAGDPLDDPFQLNGMMEGGTLWGTQRYPTGSPTDPAADFPPLLHEIIPIPSLGLICFAFTFDDATAHEPRLFWMFDHATGEYRGEWQPAYTNPQILTAGAVQSRGVFAPGTGMLVWLKDRVETFEGFFCVIGAQTGRGRDQQVGLAGTDNITATTLVDMFAVMPVMGEMPRAGYMFEELDAELDVGALGALASLNAAVGYVTSTTPTSTSAPALAEFAVAADAGALVNRRFLVGIEGDGRWIRPTVSLFAESTTPLVENLGLVAASGDSVQYARLILTLTDGSTLDISAGTGTYGSAPLSVLATFDKYVAGTSSSTLTPQFQSDAGTVVVAAPVVGRAMFTGTGPTDFQSYTADLGLGLGDRGASDALAYQVTNNQLRKMDNVFATDWVTFNNQLRQDKYTLRCDFKIKASLTDWAGFLFRCNNVPSDNGTFGAQGIYFERMAVDTYSVKYIRILNAASVVPDAATLLAGLVITNGDAYGFSAQLGVKGDVVTVSVGVYGADTYTLVATKTMTTGYNDASHLGFGIIGHHSASSGLFHSYDRYEVAVPEYQMSTIGVTFSAGAGSITPQIASASVVVIGSDLLGNFLKLYNVSDQLLVQTEAPADGMVGVLTENTVNAIPIYDWRGALHEVAVTAYPHLQIGPG